MNSKQIVCIASLLAGFAASAEAHEDILFAVKDGKLVSGGYDFDSSSVTLERVFEGELEAPGYLSDEPGFNALGDGSLLPAGYVKLPGSTPVGFSIKATSIGSQTRNLYYWNGLGAVQFGAAPDGEQLTLSKQTGPTSYLTATADGSAGDVAGFVIDTTAANGLLHKHLDVYAAGDASFSDDPAHGFYLLGLAANAGALASSDPFWIVYHVGDASDPFGEAEHEQATEWVQNNLVPEPASLGLLLFGGGALLRRRRR